MRYSLSLISLLVLLAADARGAELLPSALAPAAPPARSARADTTWLFAPSGLGAYGEAGTDAQGYTFDGTGECFEAAWTTQGGAYPAMRENLYTPGENETCLRSSTRSAGWATKWPA